MTHKEHVPETRDDAKPKLNRAQRRHPEKLQRPENEPLTRAADTDPEPLDRGDQDVASTRAKSSGHGKKTADKWNQ